MINTTLVPLLGRAALAALFFYGGYSKLMNVAGTTGYLAKLALPMPEILVWLVIAVEVLGALLILIGWQTRLVAWAMAMFTLGTAILGHRFWGIDPSQFNHQLTQFLKNVSIAGGFLMLAAYGPGRISADRR
ncbi:MAG TPA: DoxX family protein [Burkholderiales bacterium]|nr:DoxX family protein [Burkholderiales bacterium]